MDRPDSEGREMGLTAFLRGAAVFGGETAVGSLLAQEVVDGDLRIVIGGIVVGVEGDQGIGGDEFYGEEIGRMVDIAGEF